MLKRLVDDHLVAWKTSRRRKALLLRGARQVGKTWCARELGQTFESLLEVNFERDRELAILFEGRLDPVRLCERLGAYAGMRVVPGRTLLFLDEVQACPNAIRALRFFYEEMPELHVLAAGSLLEFALSEIPSFGVGRIESLYMYPMSFREFAAAVGAGALLDLASSVGGSGLESVLHNQLVEHLRTFMLTGGFPEVVQHYVTSHDLSGCAEILDDLYATIRDDFAKYRGRIPSPRLDETFRSVIAQAGGKFVYSRVSPEVGSKQAKTALELLLLAGLAHRVVHSDAQGLPLGAQVNHRLFKVIPCDIGLYHRLCNLDVSTTLFGDGRALVKSGAAAEVLAGTELLAASSPRRKAWLYYWQKERRVGNAEVDYVVQAGNDIVPVEIKAGTRGSMQSMRVFLDSHPAVDHGIRSSLENASTYGNIRVVPLYALGLLPFA